MVTIAQDTDFSYLMAQINKYRNAAGIFLLLSLSVLVNWAMELFFFFLAVLAAAGTLSYRKGIHGEKQTARVLQDLDDEYYLLNDIFLPGGYGNIDHIVLDPNDIFVIETKNYSRRISCYSDNQYRAKGKQKRGRKITSVSRQVKIHAKKMHDFLKKHGGFAFRGQFIIPLIVFPNRRMKLKTKNPTVEITGLGSLSGVIETNEQREPNTDSDLRLLVKTIIDHMPTSVSSREW